MEVSKKIPQDPLFIEHCFSEPQEFEKIFTFEIDDSPKELQNSLLLSSAAFCDRQVNNDHLLDGYSWGIIIVVDKEGLRIICKRLEEDELVRQKELKNRSKMQFGLFTGKLPCWRKWLTLGRLPELLTTGRAVERTTAHQPVYYPGGSQISFCSSYTYPSFSVRKTNTGHLKFARENPKFPGYPPKNHYTCMHPQYDYVQAELLTYSFLHSKFSRKTEIWFYSFGKDSSQDLPPIKYTIEDRVALHMFGFTPNYFIIFANSLVLEKCGDTKMIFGKPILRTLDDDYCGDLEIHLIPRDIESNLKPFSVNTRQKGYVYHTINCFEHPDGSVIVDALVSKLNESRESSQFELNSKEVYDNEGDPFRFRITRQNVENKLIADIIDSSIDFHCINPRYGGRLYKNWWMVSHTRVRSDNGDFERMVSKVYRVCVDFDGEALDFDPKDTVKKIQSSDSFLDRDAEHSKERSKEHSCYLRTPVFIPYKYPEREDDGQLFCWCYENGDDSHLSASLLVFTPNLDLLHKINLSGLVPYSVHSYVHLLTGDDVIEEEI